MKVVLPKKGTQPKPGSTVSRVNCAQSIEEAAWLLTCEVKRIGAEKREKKDALTIEQAEFLTNSLKLLCQVKEQVDAACAEMDRRVLDVTNEELEEKLLAQINALRKSMGKKPLVDTTT